MKADLLLVNGIIVTGFDTFRGNLAVKDGRVWRLLEGGDTITALETIDLKGNLLIPGLVDFPRAFSL